MANMFINAMTDLWTSVGTTYTAIKMDVTNAASATASKLIDLQVGSVSKFSVDKSGNVVAAGSTSSTGALLPAVDDGAALGSTTFRWSDLYGASGFTLNLASSNWVATHSSGILTVGTGDLRVTTAGTNAASVVTVGGTQTLTGKTLTSPVIGTSPTAAGATWTNLGTVTTADINGGTLDGTVIGGSSAAAATVTTLTVNTNANPDADDGAGLGTALLGWSDLFIASTGTLCFGGANWVATHSSGILTVGTGDLRVTTAGTNSASVVTVGGSQTLTSKTLTAPTINAATLTGTISGGTHTGASLTSPTITGAPTAAGATWTDLGTVTTVNITTFTSTGIDDNATGERLQIADTVTTLGGAVSGYALDRGVDTGWMEIHGGTVASGIDAIWFLYGGTHASKAGDIELWSNGGAVYSYDLSTTTHTFTGDLTVTGELTSTSSSQFYFDTAVNSADVNTLDGYTDWIAYTPTFTGMGTVTAISVWSKRIGDTLYIRGKFTVGTPTAVEARMTFTYGGGGITSSATKVTSIQLAGRATTSVANAAITNVLIESNKDYVTLGRDNSSNAGLTKVNGSTVFGAGDTVSILAEIPISGW